MATARTSIRFWVRRICLLVALVLSAWLVGTVAWRVATTYPLESIAAGLIGLALTGVIGVEDRP